MRLPTWALSAVLLLSDAASAKAFLLPSRISRAGDVYDRLMSREVSTYEAQVGRRSALTSKPHSVRATDPVTNATVSTACMSAISAMTTVGNLAGFAGCYNILEWDPNTALFQADLRIYQESKATGEFANVPSSQISVMLTPPDSTQINSLVKRSTVELSKRDGNAVEIQHFTLAGNFKQPIDLSRLNQTFLTSLMVPQISLQATNASTKTSLTTNMTASDSAWFVAGLFTNLSKQATQIADPATASAAIVATKGFVLPGTTLGIFPTGLIVTSTWTLLFLSAYGLGTIGRLKSRNVYRRRIVRLTARRN